MSYYSTILRRIVFPIPERIMGLSIQRYLNEFEKTQWWSRENLEELQREKLRRLIQHAYYNVPYYRELFDKRKIVPSDIRNTSDLQQLPLLTKEVIRGNFDELIARPINHRKLKKNATGGSTGDPLQYLISLDSCSAIWAAAYRGWGFADYRLGDKMVMIGGSSLFPDKRPLLLHQVRAKLVRNVNLSGIHLTEDILREYADFLTNYKPRFIRGYASSLYVLANYLISKGIKSVRPRAVIPTAEMLYRPQRKVIEEGFHCEVFNEYAARDGGVHAAECKIHNGWHISIEKVVIEILKNGKPVPPGETGEIVLTDLHNYGMPFIRYRIGDVGAILKESCPCGRDLPLLKKFEGRTSDIFKFANGVVLTGPAFTVLFSKLEFQNYQIIQLDEKNLLLRLVKGRKYSEDDLNQTIDTLKAHIGGGVNIRVEFVGEIPIAKSGKRRYFISNIPPELRK